MPKLTMGPPACMQLACVFGLDWEASCGGLEVPVFCDSAEFPSGASISLACWLLLRSHGKRKVLESCPSCG